MTWLESLLDTLNYWTIFIGMYIEGTVIPFPSELIVPPAAYNAAAGELNIFLVVIVSTLGAVAGSTTNYVAAYYLGRPIIYRFANSKFGRLCLLNQEKVEKAEKYFYDHGVIATLTGRLLPGIRQIISVPAGLAKMNFGKFLLYTTIGSGLWNTILAVMGWYLHSFVPKTQLNEKIAEYSEYIKYVILGIAGVVALFFVVKYFYKKRNPSRS